MQVVVVLLENHRKPVASSGEAEEGGGGHCYRLKSIIIYKGITSATTINRVSS